MIKDKQGETVGSSYSVTNYGMIKFWHVKRRKYEIMNRTMFDMLYVVVDDQA